MKNDSLLFHDKLPVYWLLLGFGFLVCGSANAQNLLNNPGFEDPIATNSISHSIRGPKGPVSCHCAVRCISMALSAMLTSEYPVRRLDAASALSRLAL